MPDRLNHFFVCFFIYIWPSNVNFSARLLRPGAPEGSTEKQMNDTGRSRSLLKSAGHEIPFCSHSHLLVPSRSAEMSWGWRRGAGGGSGGELRSLGKLAKPLRWFQLKLAVLPVGFINSQLTQTLTSMGERAPPPGLTIEKPPLSASHGCFFFFFLTRFCISYRAILIRSLRCTSHPKFQTPSQQPKD